MTCWNKGMDRGTSAFSGSNNIFNKQKNMAFAECLNAQYKNI